MKTFSSQSTTQSGTQSGTKTGRKSGAANRGNAPSKSQKWPLLLGFLALVGAGVGVLHHSPATPTPAPQLTQTTATVYAQKLGWKVVGTYPHDPKAFTQGLLWGNGGFYEGTGLEGQSQLRRVEFPSGHVLKKHDLPNEVFGEGLALADDKLYQLTWQSHIGYVYDRATFRLLSQFTYPNEGWGLTYDGKYLIQSDGSNVLTYLEPQPISPVRQLPVTMNGQPVNNLNELEWIDGEIWANIWQTDKIVRIDPATGQVRSYFDFTDLLPDNARTGDEDVLNGIAYDADKKRLFLTGKKWPKLFEIKVIDGTT